LGHVCLHLIRENELALIASDEPYRRTQTVPISDLEETGVPVVQDADDDWSQADEEAKGREVAREPQGLGQSDEEGALEPP
jgi:hypothetical protein